MNVFTRRDFLKSAGIGGMLLLSRKGPFGIPQQLATMSPAHSDPSTQTIKHVTLNASVSTIDLGTGKSFKAWTYNGKSPGPEIRLKEGEILRATVRNYLPEGTTVHWHGLPVPSAMDGVPNVTQAPVEPGQVFEYEFKASPPGTYMYHSHVSYQFGRGLYGPLIVEPKREERSYDKEYVMVLADWATVNGGGPEASRMGRIRPTMGMMGGMGMMGMMGRMRGRRGRPNGPL